MIRSLPLPVLILRSVVDLCECMKCLALQTFENDGVKRPSVIVTAMSEIVASLRKYIPVLEELLAFGCIENLPKRFIAQAIEQPFATSNGVPFINYYLAEPLRSAMAFDKKRNDIREHHFEAGRHEEDCNAVVIFRCQVLDKRQL